MRLGLINFVGYNYFVKDNFDEVVQEMEIFFKIVLGILNVK